MNQLLKAVDWLKETKDDGLNFKPLQMDSENIVVNSDAAFGNARGFLSQPGYLILVADKNGMANIVHFSANFCKQVTRPVLAAEVHALIL